MGKMKTVKKVVFAALIAGAVCGLLYIFLTYVPPGVDVRQVDGTVTSADARTDEFAAEIQEHRQQVIERTVMIREKVQAEIGVLDADGLALAALSEIELWRGGSGDNTPARASGLDSGERGIFHERGGAVEPYRRRENIPP
ncbi:MAG: hypothetical protein LBS53_13650 [Synergistaceae bacterium]|jgi:hypothetical protein|nr:hypothetical protein [Synergistaceae bacterium]